MDNLIQLAAVYEEEGLTIEDFILAAVARTCQAHPEGNTHWIGDHLRRFQNVNIGVERKTADGEGMVFPTIARAQRLTLSRIAKRREDLDNKIENNELSEGDVQVKNHLIFVLIFLGEYYHCC